MSGRSSIKKLSKTNWLFMILNAVTLGVIICLCLLTLSPNSISRVPDRHDQEITFISNIKVGGKHSIRHGYQATEIKLSPWEMKRKQMYNPNCKLLVDGNVPEIKRVKEKLRKVPYALAAPRDIYNWAKDCHTYRTFYAFRLKHISKEERDFPIAYSIRMHKSVEQAEQLLRNIYAPQNLYCIYIDKKSPADIHKAMRQIASCFPNVFIASKLRNFYYSTTTHVKADIRCIKDLLTRKEPWRYFINLVGEEFPIKTQRSLVNRLQNLHSLNGIQSYPFPKGMYRSRFWLHHGLVNGRNLVIPNKHNRRLNVTLYKGDEYNLFSRKFLIWMLHSPTARHLLDFFDTGTWGSDEAFWATLNRQKDTPGGSQKNTHRFAKARLWDTKYQRSLCHGPFVRGICILSVSEFKWLMRQPEPFANKFKMLKDPVVTDCLSDILNSKTKTIHVDRS